MNSAFVGYMYIYDNNRTYHYDDNDNNNICFILHILLSLIH